MERFKSNNNGIIIIIIIKLWVMTKRTQPSSLSVLQIRTSSVGIRTKGQAPSRFSAFNDNDITFGVTVETHVREAIEAIGETSVWCVYVCVCVGDTTSDKTRCMGKNSRMKGGRTPHECSSMEKSGDYTERTLQRERVRLVYPNTPLRGCCRSSRQPIIQRVAP